MDTVIGPGDEVIAISADDDTIRLDDGRVRAGRGRDRASASRARPRPSGRSSSAGTGARRRSSSSSTTTSPPGSQVTIVADVAEVDGGGRVDAAGAREPGRSRSGARDTTSRAVLDRLDVPSFDHIIVLCYSDVARHAARRREDDHHAAPPARHGAARRARLLDRVARCSTCAIGRWPRSPTPTTSSSATAGQPARDAGRRERPAQRGLRRPVRPGRAPRSTCGRPATTSRPGSR